MLFINHIFWLKFAICNMYEHTTGRRDYSMNDRYATVADVGGRCGNAVHLISK